MARRFPVTRVQSTVPRRATEWIGGTAGGGSFTQTLAVNTALILASFDTRTTTEQPLAPFTIIRTRGLLQMLSTAPGTSDEVFGAYGICIVNGEAFDAGVGSVISPITESFDDRWLYHTYWSAMTRVATLGIEVSSNILIDSKAMRKVSVGDVIISVIESGAGLSSARVISNFRMLVKLH